jgi:ATP-binding cassette subfamily B protein
VFEILDAPLDGADTPDAVPLPSVSCRVEFDDVRFRYPGSEREDLRGVSFAAEPGQTAAILGTTGSGKSTLVNLIPRFYEVTGGSVRVDGCDVREVTCRSLRAKIATVLQEPFLFSGTVAENIGCGRAGDEEPATREEIEGTARAARAGGFIQSYRRGTTRSSAKAAALSARASASCSPSPAPCSPTRASSSWTRPRVT